MLPEQAIAPEVVLLAWRHHLLTRESNLLPACKEHDLLGVRTRTSASLGASLDRNSPAGL